MGECSVYMCVLVLVLAHACVVFAHLQKTKPDT